MIVDLVLVGFGHVAQRFVSLLDEERQKLADRFDIAPRIVAIATRRHGRAYAAGGLDPHAVRDAASQRSRTDENTIDFIRDVAERQDSTAAGRLVVVETTTLDVRNGQPAIDHVRAALDAGAHVVTANKGPVAFAYDELAIAARAARRQFLFEGTVMDGVPVFNLVRETMPLVEINGFRGVINTTTNFILTAMEGGQAFDRALADMQAAGIAEADASLDVDGWDAAAKTAALANVLLGARMTPHAVDRQGISAALGARAVAARRENRRLKLVAAASRAGARVTARVSPEELPAEDLLAGLEGEQNALILETDLLGEVAIVQRGSGLTQTAYALLSDLVAVRRAQP